MARCVAENRNGTLCKNTGHFRLGCPGCWCNTHYCTVRGMPIAARWVANIRVRRERRAAVAAELDAWNRERQT